MKLLFKSCLTLAHYYCVSNKGITRKVTPLLYHSRNDFLGAPGVAPEDDQEVYRYGSRGRRFMSMSTTLMETNDDNAFIGGSTFHMSVR